MSDAKDEERARTDRWHRDVGPDELPIPKRPDYELVSLREAVAAAHEAFRVGAGAVDLAALRGKLERALPYATPPSNDALAKPSPAASPKDEERARAWPGLSDVQRVAHLFPPNDSRERDAEVRARVGIYVGGRRVSDDDMHPNGQCTCCGEGACDWCRRGREAELQEGRLSPLEREDVEPYTHERAIALVRKWTERLGCTAPESYENQLLNFASTIVHEVNGAVVRNLLAHMATSSSAATTLAALRHVAQPDGLTSAESHCATCARCQAYRSMADDEARRLGADLAALRRERDAEVSGCPCLVVGACRPSCSCASPGLSGGCSRCASYGSPEQRIVAARRIAKAVDDLAALRAVANAARRQWEASDDGHRCPTGGDECTGCYLRDALAALDAVGSGPDTSLANDRKSDDHDQVASLRPRGSRAPH